MRICVDIEAEIARLRLNATTLSTEASTALLRELETKFCEPGTGPIWERLLKATSRKDSDGWKRAASLIDGTVILVISEGSSTCAFSFFCSDDVTTLLGSMYGFEFYLTDDALRSVIAFNHHDMLIVVGSASARLHREPST